MNKLLSLIFICFLSSVYCHPHKLLEDPQQFLYNGGFFEGDIMGPDPKVKINIFLEFFFL